MYADIINVVFYCLAGSFKLALLLALVIVPVASPAPPIAFLFIVPVSRTTFIVLFVLRHERFGLGSSVVHRVGWMN